MIFLTWPERVIGSQGSPRGKGVWFSVGCFDLAPTFVFCLLLVLCPHQKLLCYFSISVNFDGILQCLQKSHAFSLTSAHSNLGLMCMHVFACCVYVCMYVVCMCEIHN